MKKLVIMLLLSGLFLLRSSQVEAEISWTETTPTGLAENKYWTALASDDDGSNLIVSDGDYGGKLYISTDSGESWTETTPATLSGSQYWMSASSSADGSKLIVTSYPGRVYISTNGGSSWTETTPTGSAVDKWWTALAADADGSNLIAAEYEGRIYVSTNGGSSWTETMPTGAALNGYWTALASDDDGSNLIVSDGDYGGKLYISTDSGESWTETTPATLSGSQWWGSASSSADGSKLIVTSSPGRVYISTNGGSSWTETLPTGAALNGYWRSSSDADGSDLIVAGYPGQVYVSDNGGSSWTETMPTGLAENKFWTDLASDAGGSHFITAIYGERIFVGTDLPDPVIPEEAPTNPPSSEEISTVIESNNNASNPNVIPGWALPIMAGPNFTGLHGFIPNTNITSDDTRLASVFIDRTTHHDDLYINHSDFNWLNILAFWNNPDEVKLPWTQGFNTVSEISKIYAKSSFNGYPVEATDNPYIILLGYDRNKLGSIPKEKLRIAKFNQDTKKWETIKGAYVYPDGKVATTTNKFGYFSVVYPRSFWGN